MPDETYITGSELSVIDIAMDNEIFNILSMLRLDDQAIKSLSLNDSEPDNVDYKDAIYLKYPCVANWMNRIENLGPVRRYQVKF